jgi:hypothetical protein
LGGRWDTGSDDEDEWSWMNQEDGVTLKRMEANENSAEEGCSSQEENSTQDGCSSQEENSAQDGCSPQEENSAQDGCSPQEENSAQSEECSEEDSSSGLAVEDFVPLDSEDDEVEEESVHSKNTKIKNVDMMTQDAHTSSEDKQSFYCKLNR